MADVRETMDTTRKAGADMITDQAVAWIAEATDAGDDVRVTRRVP